MSLSYRDSNPEKACDGGRTIENHDHGFGQFVECIACGRAVRWDLADDRFWGFQNCERRMKTAERDDLARPPGPAKETGA